MTGETKNQLNYTELISVYHPPKVHDPTAEIVVSNGELLGEVILLTFQCNVKPITRLEEFD